LPSGSGSSSYGWAATHTPPAGAVVESAGALLVKLAQAGLDVRSELAFQRLCLAHLFERGNPATAADYGRESKDLFIATGNLWGAANALETLGLALMMRSEDDAAVAECRRGYTDLHSLGVNNARIRVLTRLAMALARTGELAEAERCSAESVALAEALGDRTLTAFALGDRAKSPRPVCRGRRLCATVCSHL
jgi:hypothetical protein